MVLLAVTTSTTDPSDARLVQQCLDGQQAAFATLVYRHQAVLYNLALRMVKDAQDAEDITQSVFLKAYENLDRYDPTFKFFSWIYRMAVNESLNLIKRRRPTEDVDVLLNLASTTASPFDGLEDGELSDQIGVALMGLEPEDRALVLLKYFQGFSYEEVAYVFDIAPKTAKSRLYTARQRLKDVLLQTGFIQSGA